jgi:hypothetical protein
LTLVRGGFTFVLSENNSPRTGEIMKTYGQYVSEDFEVHGNPFDFESDTPKTAVPNAATHKQIMYIVSLATKRGYDVRAMVAETDESGEIVLNESGECMPKITKKAASASIEKLRDPRSVIDAPKIEKPAATKVELEDGMYRVALDDSHEMKIYKVQHAVHGSGRQYAKVLVQYDDGSWGFEIARGVIFKLRPEHKMSLEDAKKFGALYGTCCVCGRTLTNEESIEAGIGPICASKF